MCFLYCSGSGLATKEICVTFGRSLWWSSHSFYVLGDGAGLQGLWLLTRVAADLIFHLIVDSQHLHFPPNLLLIISLSWAKYVCKFSLTQSLSHVRLFVTLWTVARQASLSITNSWSLLKLMSIESVMPCSHLILCYPLLFPPSIFPSSESFPMSQFFISGDQNIGVSASASALPMNIQVWFPLGWTGLISLQYKCFSRVLCNTAVQKHQFFSTQLSS